MREEMMDVLTVIGMLAMAMFLLPGVLRLWSWWFCFLFPAVAGCQ